MKAKTVIYTLSDPITKEIKYVGRTTQPKGRFRNHCSPNMNFNDLRTLWLCDLKIRNLKPIFDTLELVENDGNSEELYWISQLKTWGYNLVNTSIGGSGFNGCIHSISAKNKMATTRTGMIHSEESKIKCRKSSSYGTYSISKNGSLIGKYTSSVEASKETGIDRRTINYLAKTGRKGIYFGAKGVQVSISN